MRDTHAWTYEGGPKPTHSREASKRLEGPLVRQKGTENSPQVLKFKTDTKRFGYECQKPKQDKLARKRL